MRAAVVNVNRLSRSLAARTTVATGRGVLVVALLLTAGVLGWWSFT
ncbi:hypothetical protein JQS43_22255 [Natronosporangium hydrolyticum]|uniref:Uncharacterized protein n=1 Tax=Natronosporangium hydrolyticum TaxID=2811111 RepID=A0A895YK59_9ACTN|nr:hypothetical protein [Natronosporangium hydrolyticum]QSB14208.1 hypothetical protein JQS43_22255 [Natronosporangium hydrolyticum]